METIFFKQSFLPQEKVSAYYVGFLFIPYITYLMSVFVKGSAWLASESIFVINVNITVWDVVVDIVNEFLWSIIHSVEFELI